MEDALTIVYCEIDKGSTFRFICHNSKASTLNGNCENNDPCVEYSTTD